MTDKPSVKRRPYEARGCDIVDQKGKVVATAQDSSATDETVTSTRVAHALNFFAGVPNILIQEIPDAISLADGLMRMNAILKDVMYDAPDGSKKRAAAEKITEETDLILNILDPNGERHKLPNKFAPKRYKGVMPKPENDNISEND